MVTGPIVFIEDDLDDRDLLNEILKDLQVPNKAVWFNNCADAYEFLVTSDEQPFLIFSDVNLPGLSGMDFKKKIDSDERLRKKSVPFVFFSTSATEKDVNEAYTEMTIQGYFKKPSSYDATKNVLKVILDYWKVCIHPNSFL